MEKIVPSSDLSGDESYEPMVQTFDVNEFLDGLPTDLTPSRAEIISELVQLPWFQATDPDLQREVVLLPQEGVENHDGFLSDLAKRPSSIGGVDVQRLQSLSRGNFALIPVFGVKAADGTEYTYEYVSWRYGPNSGAKGIVFVRAFEQAEPTHFITLVGEKFAPGKKAYDSLGGFMDIGVSGVQSALDRFKVEAKEETGVANLEVSDVTDLGKIYTDPGMTNNCPNLFMGYISIEDANKIPILPVNMDVHELQSGAVIFPMARLREFVILNTDSYFQSAMFKAIAAGKVAPEWLMRPLSSSKLDIPGLESH
jgi:hypothetical protein